MLKNIAQQSITNMAKVAQLGVGALGKTTVATPTRPAMSGVDRLIRNMNSLADKASGQTRGFQTSAAPNFRASATALGKPTITDGVLTFHNERGIRDITGSDPAKEAARALHFKNRVVLCTGFNVGLDKDGKPMPETDGPPGTVFLGESLRATGKEVMYVADAPNAEIIRESLKAVNPDMSDADISKMIHVFESNHEADGKNHAAKAEARKIIESADAVVAVELPDINNEGDMLNMRGVSVKNANLPIYEVVREANKAKKLTITVGDGGNEVGSGNWKGIPQALNGKSMAGVTKSDLAVKASVSNFGACGIAANLLKLHGSLSDVVVAKAPTIYEQLMHASFKAGAIDGVTRGAEPGKLNDSGNAATGVDGMSIDLHKRLLDGLLEAVQNNEVYPAGIKEPIPVGVFDSSNGAFVAGRVLKAELEKLGHKTEFIITVDHANAPYGQYTGDKEFEIGPDGKKQKTLARLVFQGLDTARALGAAFEALACNTACTVPEAQEAVENRTLDLIKTTAKAIVEHGGSNPVSISTPVTALADDYPKYIYEFSGGKIDMRKTVVKGSGPNGEDGWANMIGAPKWAPSINELEHLDPAKQEKVDAMVAEIVDKVPADATSVWLTCTHYPALQEKIQEKLKARGLDIEVINPMKYQAKAMADMLADMSEKERDELAKLPRRGGDRVYTSTRDVSAVQKSVDALYQPTPVEHRDFQGTSVQTLEPAGSVKKDW